MKTLAFISFLLGFAWLSLVATYGRVIELQYLSLALFGFAMLVSIFILPKINIGNPGLFYSMGLVLILYFLARSFFSEVRYLARHDLIIMLCVFITFSLFLYVFREAKWRTAFLFVLCFFLLLNICFIYYQMKIDERFNILYGLTKIYNYYKGIAETYIRAGRVVAFQQDGPGGIFNLHNHMTGYVTPATMLLLAFAFWGQGFKRLIFGLFALIGIVSILLSTSRGGLLNLTAGLMSLVSSFIYLKMFRMGNFKIKNLMPVLYIIVPLMAVAMTFMLAWDKLPIDDNLKQKIGGDNRTDNWSTAVEQVKLNPIFGNGSQSYYYNSLIYWSEKLGAFHLDMAFAHNDFLQTLTDYGVIGLVLAIVFFALLIINHFVFVNKDFELRQNPNYKSQVCFAIGGIAAVIGYMVHSLIDFNMHLCTNATLISVCIAFACPQKSVFVNKPKPIALSAIFIFFTILSLGIGIKYLPSSIAYQHAERFMFKQTQQYFNKLLYVREKDPLNYENVISLGNYFKAKANSKIHKLSEDLKNKDKKIDTVAAFNDIRSYFTSAMEQFEYLVTIHSYQYRNWIFLADATANVASFTVIYKNKDYDKQIAEIDKLYQKATHAFEKATELCSRRPETHDGYANFLVKTYIPFLRKNNFTPKAIEYCDVAIEHYKLVTKNLAHFHRTAEINKVEKLKAEIQAELQAE